MTMLCFSPSPPSRWRVLLLSALIYSTLAGCVSNSTTKRSSAWDSALERAWEKAETTGPESKATEPLEQEQDQSRPAEDAAFYQPGNGRFVKAPRSIAKAQVQAAGDIKLNFQNANLLEVIKVILGDMLGVTYIVDPNIQGTVSMQTAGALQHEDLIPTLEMLLRMNDAAIIAEGNVYRVMPMALAITGVRAPQLGDATLALPPGYSVRVVPLRYVAAEEMAQILEPFVTDTNQLVRVDTHRNLLILAANGGDMDRLLETIHVFDVDRMQGMSVAMFTPDFVDAKTLGEELEALLANNETGLMAGLVRFLVVERLNGLMVVTPRAEYLQQVKSWIERLDRDNGSVGSRLFIYRVQNGKAKDLADILGKLFSKEANNTIPDAEVAPGLTPVTIGENTDDDLVEEEALLVGGPNGSNNQSITLGDDSQVRVIADEANNALLIRASSIEYRQILTALRQLDVSPMQVLVEVTIAEVTLTDDLKYGVEWFFNNKVGSNLTGFGTLDLGTAGIGALAPGFSYALQNSGGTTKAVINMLANESNLSIVSSPSLLVLNNQEATIQVGDEIPLVTLERISEESTTTLNTVEYRDTGVLLKVKPRINSGGLVIMEIEQETSDAKPSTDEGSPIIQTRKITSTVAVNSGDTIILGGLIEDNYDQVEAGVPGLHEIPVVGNLFGSTTDNQARTELLVLITPRAISNRTSALQATEDFRRKLHSLVSVERTETEAANAPLPGQSAQPEETKN